MNARIVRHIRHGVVFEHGDEAPYEPGEVIVRRHVSGVYVPARGERIRGAS